MTIQEIFRSENLAVRAATGFSSAVCFVTFDSYTDQRTLNRIGFGERFFYHHGVDAFHVISRDNDWYQYAEFPSACQCIAALTASYRRVIAYGSSMGGYAAIRYGGWVNAQEAFAVSPQFSANPYRWPFERRWFRDTRGLRFIHEKKLQPVVKATILYDTTDRRDVRHVNLFRTHSHVIDVRLPGSGHPSTGFLADLGLLQSSLLSLAKETFDAGELEREAKRRRQESSQYHFVLSQRARSSIESFHHALRAVELAPIHPPAWISLAVAAARTGDFNAAFAAIDRADIIEPCHPYIQHIRSCILEMSGELNQAITIMQGLTKISPKYRDRLRYLQAKKGITSLITLCQHILSRTPKYRN